MGLAEHARPIYRCPWDGMEHLTRHGAYNPRCLHSSDYFEEVEYVPLAEVQKVVEDRDKLAAYVRWRNAPHGEAPMTLPEVEAMLKRLREQ